MRAFLEILQFEVRYQLRSPFLIGAMLIFALGNLLTITSTGININVSNLVDINSPNSILMTTLTVAAFGPIGCGYAERIAGYGRRFLLHLGGIDVGAQNQAGCRGFGVQKYVLHAINRGQTLANARGFGGLRHR